MLAPPDSPSRGTRAAAIVAALVCGLIGLVAVPALASAAPIVVNSTGDAPKKPAAGAVCETATPGECTLRAAIQAANAEATFSAIEFSSTVFEGQVGADEIEPATSLPPITEPASLAGPTCSGGTYKKPCVGVTALPVEVALKVESNGISVENMAFGGGFSGIEVLGTGFRATGDWFGLKLNAAPHATEDNGILIGFGGDGATIGAAEDEATNRNVFAHTGIGVLIGNASRAKILGNYIGVGPEGTAPDGVEVGVRIVEAPGAPSEENEIGGILTPSQATSPACDGACNVIATEGTTPVGVDLAGEDTEPVTGPTRVRGNDIGLAADGVTPAGDAEYGVLAAALGGCTPGPEDVIVGGTAPTETNHIVGGGTGIYAESAENFTAAGNAIGIAADGTESASPIVAGIVVCSDEVLQPAHVSANQVMVGPGTVGIESHFGLARITGNSIRGSESGIVTREESEGAGDLIQGNAVTGSVRSGIQVTNQSNVLVGNSISNAGGAGIELEEADHNRVGGDLPAEENSVVGSGGGAIVISGTEAERNEVAANHGSGNAEAFIQLFPQSVGELLNGGIEPPAFATVLQSTATGTAQPAATVRIFSKTSAAAGELGALLGVVKADAAGNWSATYATVPVGTLIAATQTSAAGTAEAGTSVVGTPTAATADPPKPEEPKGGGGSTQAAPSNASPPAAPKAPKAKLVSGPRKTSKSTFAKFKFRAEPAAGARFECKLDAARWAKCASPKTYRRLKPRLHTFQVRAVAAGLTGAVTKYKFTVKR